MWISAVDFGLKVTFACASGDVCSVHILLICVYFLIFQSGRGPPSRLTDGQYGVVSSESSCKSKETFVSIDVWT